MRSPCGNLTTFGISSPFGLLSPSLRQVVYALLTRLPLGSSKASFQFTSYDLHVLSTPPAFVLSQDQTLHDRLFVWLFIALLAQIIARYFYLAHRFYSFAVLFSFQRIIALQATLVVYHTEAMIASTYF